MPRPEGRTVTTTLWGRLCVLESVGVDAEGRSIYREH
jgi:hypothetical protein